MLVLWLTPALGAVNPAPDGKPCWPQGSGGRNLVVTKLALSNCFARAIQTV